jgi:predicted transcriptional regulator
MQDQRIQDEQTTDDLSEQDHDRAVLELLLCDRVPWAVEEIAREVSGKRVDVIDAIARLVATGLLHRHDDFVFLTRAARRADEIVNS